LVWEKKAEAVKAAVEKAVAVHGMHQVRLGIHPARVEETTLQGKSESSNFTILVEHFVQYRIKDNYD
tara:strand:- start:342 stop:542 length:201 start_codon:yes stop_codon:yes gene_type:complete